MKGKEEILQTFLKELAELAFVKSTNSITGEVEEFPVAYHDQEAIIVINGQWDREDLKNFLAPTLQD